MSQSYQVGDHANGHVWSGTDWVQLPNSSWVYNHQTQNYERAQVTPQSSPALPNMWSPGSNSTTATAYSQHAGGHHPGAVGGQHPNMQGFTFGAPARPPVASVEYYAGVWHSHVMTNPVLNLQTWLDTAVPAEVRTAVRNQIRAEAAARAAQGQGHGNGGQPSSRGTYGTPRGRGRGRG